MNDNVFEEKLIKSVKHHAVLYNKADFGFRSRLKRDKAWANVSAVCGMPVKQCQCRWKTLRDRYVRTHFRGTWNMTDEGDAVQWRYFEKLSFLKEHIKPRGLSTDNQIKYELLPGELNAKLENEESNSMEASSSKLCQTNTDDHQKYVPNETFIDSSNEDETPASETAEPTCHTTGSTIDQAEAEFVKVMGLLEHVLNKKLHEENNVQAADPLCTAPQAGLQDPFYKYLESILNRVDEPTRSDIQLKLLNFANTQVKNATTNGI